MSPPTKRTAPVTSEGGSQQTGKVAALTVPQPADTCVAALPVDVDRAYSDGFMAGWRDRAEYAQRVEYAAGYANGCEDLAGALRVLLGRLDDEATAVLRTAVEVHLRQVDRVDRRRAWDRSAGQPRPGDCRGRAA